MGGTEEGLWGHWWFCKGSRGAHQQKKSGEAIKQNAAAVMLYLGGKHSADHGGKPWKGRIHGNKDAPQPSRGRSSGAQGCLRGWGNKVTVPGLPLQLLQTATHHRLDFGHQCWHTEEIQRINAMTRRGPEEGPGMLDTPLLWTLGMF